MGLYIHASRERGWGYLQWRSVFGVSLYKGWRIGWSDEELRKGRQDVGNYIV